MSIAIDSEMAVENIPSILQELEMKQEMNGMQGILERIPSMPIL